mmetsp:Transcript_25152/g.31572  ORF Transcript_25152/g.31572 Transcript_25152/m.31572 type:complete len:325 (+) Transcript_25152:3-977(+)
MILVNAGLIDKAKIWFDEALRLAAYTNDEDIQCSALMAAASGAAQAGEFQFAVQYLEKVVTSRRGRLAKKHPLLVSVLCAVAMARNQLDSTATESFKAYDEALIALRALRNGPSIADVPILFVAAKAASKHKQSSLALDLASQAQEILASSAGKIGILTDSQVQELQHIIDPTLPSNVTEINRAGKIVSQFERHEHPCYSGSDEYTTSGADEVDDERAYDTSENKDLGGRHPMATARRLDLYHQLSQFAYGKTFDFQCLDYVVPVPYMDLPPLMNQKEVGYSPSTSLLTTDDNNTEDMSHQSSSGSSHDSDCKDNFFADLFTAV